MSGYNYCCLVGNLVRDPELTYLASGTPVVNCTIAVNETFGKEKHTLFMPFSIFGKTAEVMMKYAKKGNLLLVSGFLSQYTTSKGETKVSHTKLSATTFKFMGDKSRAETCSAEPTPDPEEFAKNIKPVETDVF